MTGKLTKLLFMISLCTTNALENCISCFTFRILSQGGTTSTIIPTKEIKTSVVCRMFDLFFVSKSECRTVEDSRSEDIT
jgi:hypothetical protein